MNTPPRGPCRICGEVRPLTAEHVIPKSAGNDQPTRVHTLRSVVAGLVSGERFQAGLVRRTLCARCNSRAGAWYVPAFARWTLQAWEYHSRVTASVASVALPFVVSALPLAKELAVIALAMSEPPSLPLAHFLNLRRLVIDPRAQGRTPLFRFFTYFHVGPPVFEGTFAAIDTSGGPGAMVYCHVGLEPLGYVVTDDSNESVRWARALRLCDLSYLFECPPNVVRHDFLMIPPLRGELPFRGSRPTRSR